MPVIGGNGQKSLLSCYSLLEVVTTVMAPINTIVKANQPLHNFPVSETLSRFSLLALRPDLHIQNSFNSFFIIYLFLFAFRDLLSTHLRLNCFLLKSFPPCGAAPYLQHLKQSTYLHKFLNSTYYSLNSICIY